MRISSPEGTRRRGMVDRAAAIAETTGGSAALEFDPVAAVTGADVVVTDTWVSMGKEEEAAACGMVFAPYSLTTTLFEQAKPDAIAMHCLPAYRGKGDRRRGPRRPAERRLGRGREPPARTEGDPVVPRRGDHMTAPRRSSASPLGSADRSDAVLRTPT